MAPLTRLAAIVLLAGLMLPPFAGGTQAPSPSLSTLLVRHSPILVLHPAERFRPVPVEGFLADADLQRATPTGWENLPVGPLLAGGADLRLDHRLCRSVEGVSASPCYAQAEADHGASPVVYAAARRTKDRVDLQYWLWYPYDDYSPTVPAGGIWQVHEGDWESVAVVVDLRGKPLFAAYSQHGKGKRRAWGKVPKQRLRPVVYVGLGSHANFFGPGEQPLDPRIVDPALISVIEAYGSRPVDNTGRGSIVRPTLVRVTATNPGWMMFAGAWGETGYLHVPDREPIAAGLGPRAPAFQKQWRFPVKEELSWPRG